MTTMLWESNINDNAGRAQEEIDAHVLTDANCRCQTCGETPPCQAYERALRTFARLGRLPRRRPGWTRTRSSHPTATDTTWTAWFLPTATAAAPNGPAAARHRLRNGG